MTGQRAHEIGLVNDLVSPEKVLPRAIERARELAALPSMAVRATKQRFREKHKPGLMRLVTLAFVISWSATPRGNHNG